MMTLLDIDWTEYNFLGVNAQEKAENICQKAIDISTNINEDAPIEKILDDAFLIAINLLSPYKKS